MSIQLPCPKCAASLSAPDATAGKHVTCPKCGVVISVPGQPTIPVALPVASPVGPSTEGPGLMTSCKVCGQPVAREAVTCPRCGISRPGAIVGTLIIMRSSAITGVMSPITIVVDEKPQGELRNGQTLTISLPRGKHTLQATGGLLSKSTTIDITDGCEARYQVRFSNWGILGGGLIIEAV